MSCVSFYFWRRAVLKEIVRKLRLWYILRVNWVFSEKVYMKVDYLDFNFLKSIHIHNDPLVLRKP